MNNKKIKEKLNNFNQLMNYVNFNVSGENIPKYTVKYKLWYKVDSVVIFRVMHNVIKEMKEKRLNDPS